MGQRRVVSGCKLLDARALRPTLLCDGMREDEPSEERTDVADAAVGLGIDSTFGMGTRLGRYDLVSVLGAGGMGVVFEARDPDLDRAVAVKVLSAHGGAGGARLRREGVTMARLTHPNVIRVYDVGFANGHTFVAMELIRGCTLAAWLERAPRTTSDVIAVFLEAGRGLAAAHDAGLVHRDFKPQNVLVGDDGRVLVTDFGLARMVGDCEPSRSASPATWSPSDEVTRAGEIIGTPAYMAPEQHTCAVVDARADQFSFCVALWRSLRATQAGSSEPTAAHSESTTVETKVPWPTLTGALPVSRRIAKALARGLEVEPGRRFRSMHELLASLEPRRGRTRRRWIAGGIAAVIGGTIAFIALSHGTANEPCPAPASRLSSVWNSARRHSLEAHLIAVDPAKGSNRFAVASDLIDAYVSSWDSMHVEACRDTRTRGKQSMVMLAQRTACLERRFVEVDETIAALLRATDHFAVDEAMLGIAALPSLEECADIPALTEKLPAPADPDRRAEFDAIVREIAIVNARGRISSERGGLEERARAAIERARKLDEPTAIADALWALALLQLQQSAEKDAIATLRTHVTAAAGAHDDRMVAESWTRLVDLVAGRPGHADEADGLLPAARAAVARAGSSPRLRAALLRAESSIARRRNDFATAIRSLEEGLRLLEPTAAVGDGMTQRRIEMRMELAKLYVLEQNWTKAADACRAAVAAIEATLGVDHPLSVTSTFDLGVSLGHLGDRTAVTSFLDAGRIVETRLRVTGQ
jgi:eukaryotic-like serine/threonine-protein kinase